MNQAKPPLLAPDQILTAAEMQTAEARIFASGISESALMEQAGAGAAAWVHRIAAGRPITVLCGPGNNGGDGYVIARRLWEGGYKVRLIAPLEPASSQAQAAAERWAECLGAPGREDGDAPGERRGAVLVDCLFGTGLSRPLDEKLAQLLRDLVAGHERTIAVDLPSGLSSDSGAALNENLPDFDVTLALGALKFAHCLAPARLHCGMIKTVPLGIEKVDGAARQINKPAIAPPAFSAHKYTRGLCAIVGGAMPGAGVLSASAAMRSGAGYVKLLSLSHPPAATDAGLVVETGGLQASLADDRLSALLVGPGLGRDEEASERLQLSLDCAKPCVLDADALFLLTPQTLANRTAAGSAPIIATPHEGELQKLCANFAVAGENRFDKARALAKASGMIILAKGPDSYVVSPDGALAIAPPSTSWLSVAGSGDVLAGIIASRLATGKSGFDAVCEAVWLHICAARKAGPAFTAETLARAVTPAMAAALAPVR